MTPVNPVVVMTPDGRVGCLVARHELHACIEFGSQRTLETYPLIALHWRLTPSAPVERRRS